MQQLYILRHGIAVPHGTPGIAEDERPLASKGEKRIRQVGRALASLDLQIERIVTSPLPRAMRTAELVAEALGLLPCLERSSVLAANSDARSIRDWLRERAIGRLMIVGHNPSLSDLVGLLVMGEADKLPLELKKGGIAALSVTPQAFPLYRIDWIAPPGLIRHVSRKE